MSGPNSSQVSLSYPEPPNSVIRYGAQPPQLSGPVNLVLMKDKEEFNKGPAYLFMQQYNKTVIIHNSDLPRGLQGSKRSLVKRWISGEIFERPAGIHRRDSSTLDSQWSSNSVAEPADKPWYCFWPGTILEGFVFIQQDATQTTTASTASSGATAMTPAPAASVQVTKKRQTPANLQPYPKVVKIEERRNFFNNIKPYCQQMQILNNNQPGPLRDPVTQQLIQIQLDESEPFVQHQFDQQNFGPSASGDLRASPALPTGVPGRKRAIDKRGPMSGGPSCQCEWMSS